MFKKCILILAASCMMYSCATQTESNPFLTDCLLYTSDAADEL